MESTKEKRSKEYIEGAFLQLLQRKPIEKISVTELCQRAGVNRSTFYAHYLDVYDLMDRVTESFVHRLFYDMIEGLGKPMGVGSDGAYDLVMKALDVTLKDRDLCRLLMRARTNISVRLMDEVVNWCANRYAAYSDNRNADYRADYTMVIGGAIVLWYDWIRSDFAAPKENLTRAITNFINTNVTAIWA